MLCQTLPEEKYGFLITKPLQLMVVMAMMTQLPKSAFKELLIVDCFANARAVSQRLSLVLPRDCSLRFFEDEKSAYSWARSRKYSKMFIDSDVGFQRGLTLVKLAIRSPQTTVAVYEEGIGTYRHDLYFGLRKRVLESLGCGVYFGGNVRTKELYIFNPDDCDTPVRAKKIKIDKKINEILNEKEVFFKIIFDSEVCFNKLEHRVKDDEECAIYLSDWKIDAVTVYELATSFKFVLVKPHPHIKELKNFHFGPKVELVSPEIPAEMLMAWASARFKLVKVFHHGSSVMRYVQQANIIYKAIHKDLTSTEDDRNEKICKLS